MGRTKKAMCIIAVCMAAAVSLGANAAFAGEVTGSGHNVDENQGKSW